ncbi:MAG: hypothetical protein B7X04_00755 [Parcubacteria group bacterium 21-54-25]|nr:MAG: hypothetical protein B7X04_00755 [Parcubacteria group bacterium 21-54-25]HQU07960.1 M50 family metallopeptidase [Candidatus Paceibacterota bacterium]
MSTLLVIAGMIKIAIIFVAALALLVLVHEAGHFMVAKIVGMRVDEFGIGFPPRALTIGRWGDTAYTLNWLPLGGFVRIYGEDGGVEENGAHTAPPKAFTAKSSLAQALVLVAGVTMNIVLAWVCILGALTLGTPSMLAVDRVLPHSPAAQAGLEPGDVITQARGGAVSWSGADPTTFAHFISNDTSAPIQLSIVRAGEHRVLTITPSQNIIPSAPTHYAIGVETVVSGAAPIAFSKAFERSFSVTWQVTAASAGSLVHFFGKALTFSANLTNVAGPIGIAGIVGNAPASGPGYFLFILALISINLAIINLIPIPALDGGRLLFVVVEALTRRKIPPRFAQTANTIGLAFIIGLVLIVSVHDVFRLLG